MNYTTILIPNTEENSEHLTILKCVKSFDITTSEGEFSETNTEGNLVIGIPKYMNREYYEAQILYVCADNFFFLVGDYFIDITEDNVYRCINGTTMVEDILVVDGRPATNCKLVVATTSIQVISENSSGILHIDRPMVNRYVDSQGSAKFTLEKGILQ